MKLTSHLVWIVVVAQARLFCCVPPLPDDLPGLVELMGSSDMADQTCAARKVYERYGVDGLLTALDSPRAAARVNGALFLRLHPDPKARAPLLRASHDLDPVARGWAVFALSAFPGQEVEARVKEVLKDPDATVRSRAQESLDILLGRAAEPQLIPVWDER